jgi:23S rRNA-/tRNA-specific pseudouridylate synthase
LLLRTIVHKGLCSVGEVPPPEPARSAPATRLGIVFEDHQIVVIDKPKGLMVHPAATITSLKMQTC